METTVLKRRLSSFRTPKGKLTRVADEVLVDVLQTWEQWPGTSTDMARELGLTMRQLVILVEKAKKLLRDNGMSTSDFKEIKIEPANGTATPLAPCNGVELVWNEGKVIRFAQVDMLVDFLKKVA